MGKQYFYRMGQRHRSAGLYPGLRRVAAWPEWAVDAYERGLNGWSHK